MHIIHDHRSQTLHWIMNWKMLLKGVVEAYLNASGINDVDAWAYTMTTTLKHYVQTT
jgi:hypothetical protein